MYQVSSMQVGKLHQRHLRDDIKSSEKIFILNQFNPFMPRKRLLGGFLQFFVHEPILRPNENRRSLNFSPPAGTFSYRQA